MYCIQEQMSDIDLLLYRQIKDGKQYDKLFPKSKCKSTYAGSGMTDFSVTEMQDMVKQFFWQTAKVAPLLKKSSLQATCNAIHDFAYWHFQYKADKEDQILRSPACSWYSRYDGIDCKSYSILASCILTNLGVVHYIRRIKQPGFLPNLWTHVYIIVPVDQKGGKLTKGYHTIDGTVFSNNEPLFTEKSDIYMSMDHYRLNGPAPQQGVIVGKPQGLNGMFDGLKQLSVNNVSQMFQKGWSPSCINGSLNDSHFQNSMTLVVLYFNEKVNKVNESIAKGSPSLIDDINLITRTASQIWIHATLKSYGNWSSACSRKAVNSYVDLGKYYYDLVNNVFIPWLNHYFDITHTNGTAWSNLYDIAVAFDRNSDFMLVNYYQVTSIKPKVSTTTVKAFEFTPYVADPANVANFSLNKFIDGLKTVATVFGPVVSAVTGGGGTTGGTRTVGTKPTIESVGNTGKYIDPATGLPYKTGKDNVVTAGGVVTGLVIASAGLAYMFSKGTNVPAGKTNSKVATKSPKPATKKNASKKTK